MDVKEVDALRAARTPTVVRFEEIVARVRQPVLRFLLRRTDAESAADVLSDTLLVLWRRLDDVPAEAELPWAYAVANSCLANHRRGQRRHRALVAKIILLDPPADADPPEEDLDLSEALKRLPPDDQEILRLWAWEQLEPREIAGVLDVSANVATVRLHRAKKKLAAALKDPGSSRTQTSQGKE